MRCQVSNCGLAQGKVTGWMFDTWIAARVATGVVDSCIKGRHEHVFRVDG